MLPAPRRPGSAAWALTPRTCSCQRRPSDKELGDESGDHDGARDGRQHHERRRHRRAAAAVTVEVPPGVPLGTAASAPLALPAPNGSSWAPACWTRCSTARWYWPGGSPPLTG